MEFIGPGDHVEVVLQTVSNLEDEKYKTKVVKVLENNKVAMELIKRNDYVSKLAINTPYTFIVYTKSGIYKHEGKIVEYKKVSNGDSGSVCAIVELSAKGEKQQRRAAFRCDCKLAIKFDAMRESEGINIFENQEGQIVDISAGGIKFLSNTELKSEDKISLEVFFSDEVHFLVAVIKYVDIIEARLYKYQYRAKFKDLPANEEDKIIQFVLDEQRRLIKKRNYGS